MSIEKPMLNNITLASMLINTNGAFTGVVAQDISNLAINEIISLLTGSYDSGTEKNSELWQLFPI